MKQYTFTIIIALVVLLFLGLAGRYGFTVVRIEDAEEAIQSEAFDPVAYVDGIWDARIMPAFNEKAVELSTILSEIEVGTDGTASKESLIPIAQKNGLITAGEAHVYLVRGSGTISKVTTETSQGTIEITFDCYDGPVKTLIYIGPRIPNDETSIRDGVGFISIGDFREQTEYGKAGQEINKRVLSQVLGSLDKNSLMGKTITFMGAFNIRTFNLLQIKVQEIRIVPVAITLGG
ncbi:MAG: DUF2291 domain-containing protein [Chloroflexi bacterium]|nr:MAG: DUF2291 domain-containing protein [Chloroflexota bacterium]